MARRPPLPIGFAHRGARAECRDNTMGAFRRALDLGAPGLESDAWITADGVVVLDHDGVVRRRWRRSRVAGLVRRALPAHIPALADLYPLIGGDIELSLDVKDPAAAAGVVEVARRHRATDRLWLCAPDPRLLMRWRDLDADVRLVLSTRLGRGGIHPAPPEIAAMGIDAVNLRAPEWSAPLVAECHAAGLAAFGWDAQHHAELKRVLALGLDGVYSDHVARMVAALAASRDLRRS